MGGIFSAPKLPPPPPPAPTPPDPAEEERKRRVERLERQRRGRSGLITTSRRGLLASDEAGQETLSQPRASLGGGGKTKLGE